MRVVALASVLVSACAGAARRSSGPVPGQPASSLTIDLGVATPADIDVKGRRIIEQNRYEITRTILAPNPEILYETAWLRRQPLNDERKAGVETAQSRIILRARQRNYSGASGDTWQVSFMVENQVRKAADTDFEDAPISGEFEKVARRMAGEIKTLFETGIRRG
jgi:hypothetical protein